MVLLGCTLYSHVLESARARVASAVQDFRRIKDWTVERHNVAHAIDVAWLKASIREIRSGETLSRNGKRKKIVVMTHHAPVVRGASDPVYEGNAWSSVFCIDLLGKEDTFQEVDLDFRTYALEYGGLESGGQADE